MKSHPFHLIVLLFLLGISAVRADLQIEVQRKVKNEKCSAGYLVIDGKAICYVLELPWRNNLPEISSIPAGTYNATIRTDGPKHWRIELQDVPDRKNVQIHIGNTLDDTIGCLLPGMDIDLDHATVKSSAVALQKIADAMAAYDEKMQQSMMISVKISE